MIKLVVTEKSPVARPTMASLPVGAVFGHNGAWYLKMSDPDRPGKTDVWSFTAGYKTFFNDSDLLVQLPTSVEVRVTP